MDFFEVYSQMGSEFVVFGEFGKLQLLFGTRSCTPTFYVLYIFRVNNLGKMYSRNSSNFIIIVLLALAGESGYKNTYIDEISIRVNLWWRIFWWIIFDGWFDYFYWIDKVYWCATSHCSVISVSKNDDDAINDKALFFNNLLISIPCCIFLLIFF